MADIKNTEDEEKKEREKRRRIEKNIERVSTEVRDYVNFQRFTLDAFKRSDSFKKYTSLETYIPETNKSISADVVRLLAGRFKEKKRLKAVVDENGNRVLDENGKAKMIEVKRGIVEPVYAELVNGSKLKNEQIIISGHTFVNSGDKVVANRMEK